MRLKFSLSTCRFIDAMVRDMSVIDLTIVPRERDLGGFTVRRLLPYAKRRMVGPFIFLDQMGPADFAAGEGIDVRPHPHIGLATLTYLFEGEILHRDTLGSLQTITPGAVNWMTAGRGIAHSERMREEIKSQPHAMHGLQSWIALPKEAEETAPEFFHHAANVLPEWEQSGVQYKLIAGEAFGHAAPVKIYSPLFYVEIKMPAGSVVKLPDHYRERALFLVRGQLRAGDTDIAAGSMPVFAEGERVVLEARSDAHLVVLGGEPLSEPRFIWWNFVSSSQERIEQAKADWEAGRFGRIPGDAVEFIPLPEA